MTPYRTTQVFDQDSLPAALRREHCTKDGAWGVVRVLEGRLRLVFADREEELTPERPGLLKPQETHFVEPVGTMRMQVEFYCGDPSPWLGAAKPAPLPLAGEG